MQVEWTELIDIIIHTLLSILSMFIVTKVLGKRQLSEMSLFGYISGISIGNIAAYIALEQDQRLLALVSLFIWGAITFILERITMKNDTLQNVIDGQARLLVEDGVVYRDAFKKELITVEEFLEQLHDHDVYRIEDVQTATIEASGDITVLLKTNQQPFTPSLLGIKVEAEREPITIIIDGNWETKRIAQKHLSIDHFEKLLKKHHIKHEDVFIAQAYDKQTVYICFMNGESTLITPQADEPIMTINEFKDMLVRLNKFLQQHEQK